MRPRAIVTTILVLLVLGALGYIWSYAGDKPDATTSQLGLSEGFTLSPQTARTTVTIDRATLAQGGYVVIRGSDGARISQVIEISPYLEAGTHEDITINLGDFYTYDESDQLIAMIYYDDGDRAFNDLDQPSETPTAIFVETGAPVPLSVLNQQAATVSGMGMETVRYTNTGFQPSSLTVPIGTMVDFVNQSDKEMWVASNVHPAHDILPTFDQFKGAPKGQSYMYTFDKKGAWPYHDHINPALEGIITVE